MTDTGPCGEPATNRIRVTRDDPGLRPNRRVQLRRRALGRTTEDRYRRVWPGCRHRDRALRPFPTFRPLSQRGDLSMRVDTAPAVQSSARGQAHPDNAGGVREAETDPHSRLDGHRSLVKLPNKWVNNEPRKATSPAPTTCQTWTTPCPAI